MAFGWHGQYYKYREFSLNLLAIYKQRADVQAFLEIILSLTTLIVFIVFAIKPTTLTMVNLNKEINSKEETLNSLNQKIQDLQTANSVFLENQVIVPDVDASIFSLPQPDTISKQILGLATKDNVTLQSLSIGQTVIIGQPNSHKGLANIKPLPNGARALSVTINAKGNYVNIVTFLTDLENLRIPIKIDTVTINSSQLTSDSSLIGLVSARVPYLESISIKQ